MATHVYPTVAEVIATDRTLIEEFGGTPGLRDRAALESAVFRPQSGYYADLLDEVAALMESLANNHPFVDGNKRIAFVMADVMLRMNGYFIEVDVPEGFAFISESLERHEFRASKIRDWLTKLVRAL